MTYFIVGIAIGFTLSYFIARYFWPDESPPGRPDSAARAQLVAAESRIARLEAEMSDTLTLRERLARAELEVAQLETLLSMATARRPARPRPMGPTRIFGNAQSGGLSTPYVGGRSRI